MPDPVPPATVLVAEDDADQRAMLSEILVQAGYRVLGADNGNDTIERVRSAQPDVVLLDITMPGMSGWNVLRQIRDDYTLGNVRIVVVSGLADTWDRDASIAAGADSHLAKPVQPAHLLAEVRKVLTR